MLLLALKENKSRADIILIGWFLGIATHCFYFYLVVTDAVNENTIIQSLGSAFPVLHIPIIFLYTTELVERSSLKHWIAGISPYLFYSMLFYFTLTNDFLNFRNFEVFISDIAPIWIRILSPSMVAIALLFLWLIRLNIKRQEVLLHQNFSNEQKRTLSWLNYWLMTIGIGGFIIVISIFLADTGLYSYSISYTITFLFINIQLLLVGIYGLKQTPIFVDQHIGHLVLDASKTKYEKSLLNEKELEDISKKLIQIMEVERLYLNPDLSISDLSERIDQTNVQVSQTLNQKQEENFFDFVNQYRVEEVKRKLADPNNDHLSILGIALDSGFTSKSTFNKCFKRFTGLTPSVFKKELQNKSIQIGIDD